MKMFVKLFTSSRLNVDKEIESGHIKMLGRLCYGHYCLQIIKNSFQFDYACNLFATKKDKAKQRL